MADKVAEQKTEVVEQTTKDKKEETPIVEKEEVEKCENGDAPAATEKNGVSEKEDNTNGKEETATNGDDATEKVCCPVKRKSTVGTDATDGATKEEESSTPEKKQKLEDASAEAPAEEDSKTEAEVAA